MARLESLACFGLFISEKGSRRKDSPLFFMAEHADRMVQTFETVGATSTVRGSFIHAGITGIKSGDTYILKYNEEQVRRSAGFREVSILTALSAAVCPED
jgi:hypothetical protein